MKLKVSKNINENIITVNIGVIELGTSNSVADEEENMLLDFPRSVRYSDINFKGNMKIDTVSGDPVVTDSEVENKKVVSIEIKDVINKEYPINKDMEISFAIDVSKIPEAELDSVFTTVEMLGKARAELFATKIQEEIGKKLAEIRALNTKFEGDTEIVL